MAKPEVMKFGIFLALSFIFFSECVLATPADSTKKEVNIPTLIKYIDGNAFASQRVSYHSLDTTLNGTEIINPAYSRHYNNLANLGSAASPQEFRSEGNAFSDGGFHSYDLYLFNGERIRYYKTNKAFTQINYHLGGGKEQQIEVALSENINANWNIGLNFNRLGSTGFLKNGTTLHSNFDLYTWLHSADNRYNLLAFACWNTIENKVNGGLHNDSIYDNSSVSNLALQGLLINLADAENHFRSHRFSLSQYYDVHFHAEEKNSDTTKKATFKPDARISHSVSLEARSFTYLDYNPGTYYKNSFRTVSSLDSLHYYDLRNRISWASILNRKEHSDSSHSVFYSVALEHQWFRYDQLIEQNLKMVNAFMENVSANASLSNPENEKSVHWKATASYVIAGNNKTNYQGEISLHTPLSSFGCIDVSGKLLLKSPEFIYERFFSNHFKWENDFGNSQVKNISARYSFPKYQFAVGAEMTTMSHYIYVDSSVSPVQATNEIQILKYFLNKNFRLGKFHFDNSVIAQKVSNENILHLPSFISTQSLYYESFLYKNALLLQAGFDFHFNSSYYADAFMPATGLFYWQKENKTGGFSLVDFFINFRIKTARMFLKFENIGDNFLGKGYYLTPHYPMQGMTIQFGVVWRFFDQ